MGVKSHSRKGAVFMSKFQQQKKPEAALWLVQGFTMFCRVFQKIQKFPALCAAVL